jgi:ABC-2 type transport system permease protein
MNKTWIFFKLRMLQLKSDKTALFFCYILPVILLLGVGYPLQNRDNTKIELWYSGSNTQPATVAMMDYLGKHKLVNLLPYNDPELTPKVALESNKIKHYLELRDSTGGSDPHKPTAAQGVQLYANSLLENRVENAALQGILDEYFRGPVASVGPKQQELTTNSSASYLTTLLPGIIGMTLLVIGLNGFGAVLIEEKDHGLFKNIKTIDASPMPFLAGLFISRMLVAYSVAVALYALGVLTFNIPLNINHFLLFVVITLGSTAFLGLGLVLASVSPSVSAFNGIINFVQMPFIILGGVFFSINAFPNWLQVIAKLMPLTQLNIAVRQLMFNSVGFGNIAAIGAELAVLTAWTVMALVIVRLRFKW